MRSQRGQGRYLGALAGPLMLAGLLTTGLGPAAAVPACQTWTAVPPLNPGTQDNELESVNVLSGSDAWAVGVSHDAGPDQTLIEHWDGSSWSVVPSPILAAATTSSSRCVPPRRTTSGRWAASRTPAGPAW